MSSTRLTDRELFHSMFIAWHAAVVEAVSTSMISHDVGSILASKAQTNLDILLRGDILTFIGHTIQANDDNPLFGFISDTVEMGMPEPYNIGGSK